MQPISCLSAPIHVWWDITRQCNFACKHCYARARPRADNELTTDEALDAINQLKAMQVGYVYVLGGEPLMRPDFATILDYFRQCDIPLMLNTNGWFVDEPWAQRLAQSSVRDVRFSLDGARPETHDGFRGKAGSFDRVVRGIRLCREAGVPRISCSFTMTKENVEGVAGTVELLVQLGADDVQFAPISDTGRASDHRELALDPEDTGEVAGVLARSIEKYGDRLNIYSVDGTYDRPCTRCVKKGLVKPMFMGCQAGRTCFCIDWEGKVIPCLLWRDPLAGSVREQSLSDIWADSPLFRHLRRHRGEDYPECADCFYSDVCARECPLSPSQDETPAERRRDRVRALAATARLDAAPCVVVSAGCEGVGTSGAPEAAVCPPPDSA